MLATIRTALKTKLQEISEFAFVYDYHKVGVDGYPCATFEPARVNNIEHDDCNNKITYDFDIVIQQEISVTKRGEGMDILVIAYQRVINEINKDRTLGGLCLRIITNDINFGEVIHDKGDILYVSISVSCETLSFNA